MDRRDQILAVAADLFARDGFHGISIVQLGAACGVTGPAIYKHFRSKQAILAEMLVAISEELLEVGRQRAREADGPAEAIHALVGWHAEFATHNKALIIVQERDWAALPVEAREKVRSLQRDYVDLWARQLRGLDPTLTPRRAKAMAHATFGLINSTPHSAVLPVAEMQVLLTDMALRALGR